MVLIGSQVDSDIVGVQKELLNSTTHRATYSQPAACCLVSHQLIIHQVRCVHPLKPEKVLINRLPACKWSGIEHSEAGVCSAVGFLAALIRELIISQVQRNFELQALLA